MGERTSIFDTIADDADDDVDIDDADVEGSKKCVK